MGNRRSSPARTPEARESQMINLAMMQAEKQLREGKASPLIVSHFLKLGTAKANLERQKLEAETELAKAKVQVLESQKKYDEIAGEALAAFRSYIGSSDFDEDDEYYDYDEDD